VDEKVIEELEFHKQTVQSDEHSPLHLIREKEMEISGRVLAAKRQADEIVSDARRQASAMMTSAHDQAAAQAGERDAEVKAEMEQQIADVGANAEAEAAALVDSIESRKGQAITFVVDSVVRV
jgi:vacuolar-type H+-ATPase subunit H